MAWVDIKREVRSRLGEPSPAYWTDRELEDWYNEGVLLQHFAVWQAVLNLEERAFAAAMDNEYTRTFMTKTASVHVAGTQDYSPPGTMWRLVRVTVTINGVECPCDFVPFADDWEVRNLPHRFPSPTRPKYTVTPEAKVRFYMAQGAATVPNGTNAYTLYYAILPLAVTIEAGAATPQDVTLLGVFNTAPKAYMCYRAVVKQYDDGGPYFQEMTTAIQLLTPGPSKEVAETKAKVAR